MTTCNSQTADIARRFIENHVQGLPLSKRTKARSECKKLIEKGFWPCYFNSDTSGEKSYEEFYTKNENVNQIYLKHYVVKIIFALTISC